MRKKAGLLQQVVIHLILIGLIFALFFMAAESRVNSRAIKQQIIEKQTALLIDSAVPDTTLVLKKINQYGTIDNLEIKEGRIFVYVNKLTDSRGYPYFSRYIMRLESDKDNFYIKIMEK
ncbi:hypothetical protein FJZ19_05385 [Candidatus Pacearchaeota archaeon]|nr:hypothetical protein [Candidatus Pacearchaeota archaeon]